MAQELCWLGCLLALLSWTAEATQDTMVEQCGINPREEILNFVAWILAPVALGRLLIFAMYRTPRNYQTFLSFSFAVSVYYHGTFGFWTLENFMRMI